jgi:hypothetical protein
MPSESGVLCMHDEHSVSVQPNGDHTKRTVRGNQT